MFQKMSDFIKSKLSTEPSIKQLVDRGLKVGRNFSKQKGCIIDPSHCWLITIGNNVTLAPNVHILAHDASTKRFLDYTKVGKVTIGNDVFVGAGTIILPNVNIGNNVIIGAGSVVTKNIPDNSLIFGNPARVIGDTGVYLQKNKELMKDSPVYDASYTINGQVTNEKKVRMKEELTDIIGFIK